LNKNDKQPFTTGIYLLETLTSGMYNNPLMIYREYIQNAVDSIDNSSENGTGRGNSKNTIDITIDPINKSILIRDNANGISSRLARSFLSTIGGSLKTGTTARGFRGIGRLGGIAFCDKITFTTSSFGQKIVSKQVWDCIKLRNILGGNGNHNKAFMSDILDRTVKFTQSHAEIKGNTYFEVLLEGVSSYRNTLLDIQKVRKYITEVAPLPFNHDAFIYAPEIEQHLLDHINYKTYSINLNGQKLYKPYTNEVPVMKGRGDKLYEVECKTIKFDNGELLAVYWIGMRERMKGAITRGDLRGGIKIRVGDILIGDSHLLNQYFREPRFNHYCVGEIHIVSDKLIPNGRRDDFVDNEYKSIFYHEFERVLGLPLSKEIRFKSRELQTSSTISSCIRSHRNENQLQGEEKVFAKEDLNSRINTILADCDNCHNAKRLSQVLNES